MRTRTAAGVAVLLAAGLIAGCSSSGGGSTGTSAPPSSAGSSSIGVSPTGSGAPSGTPSGGSSSTPTGTAPAPGPAAVHQKLTNFRIVDVTFVGTQAWALGSADCLSGKGTCDAVEYSGDGGRTWRSAPAPRASVATSAQSCTGTCVSGIRFATSRIGYAFGPRSFFTTTDSGNTWTSAAGSAVALESLDGNVIRVRTSTPGCPPGCSYHVETAPLTGAGWTRVNLPGPAPQGDGVTLARTGSHAYLQAYGNPAGGAQHATSVLWTSSNDGASWTNRGEVCPQIGGEVDSRQVMASPDGQVASLCARRGTSTSFVIVSTDRGAHFRVASTTALGSAPPTDAALGSSSTVLVASDATYRSSDGGGRYARVLSDPLRDLGFATPLVAHGVSADGRSLWTSTDGGVTWTRHRFS